MTEDSRGRELWRPSEERASASALAEFSRRFHHDPRDYQALHRWSVEHPDRFWRSVWEFCEVVHGGRIESVLGDRLMPGATWFEGVRLNFAENLLRHQGGRTALIFEGCSGQKKNQGRDLECQPQNNLLSTTGFATGGAPTIITPCQGCGAQLNVGGRFTHPAVAGSASNDRWLLFYMKNKSLWYTRIKRTP